MPEFRNLRNIFHQWGGATTAFFVYIHTSHDINAGLLIALLPLIRTSLGLSYLQSGLLISAYSITSGLSQFLGGWLSDRIDRRIVIAIGLGGVGFFSLAIGLSQTYYIMIVVLVLMGIFAGAYHPSASPMLSSRFEAARRGKVLGLHLVGGALGFSLGPIFGGVIAEELGWRYAFIILSIPALVAVPLVLKRLKQKEHVSSDEPVSQAPVTETTQIKPMPRRASLLQVLRPVAVVISLAILTQLIAGSAMSFLPLYLVDKHAASPTYAAMLLGIIRGGGVVGSLFGGWLSDKWGGRNASFLTLIVTGPLVYLFTTLPFNTLLVIILILLGFFMQMRQATVQPYLINNTPPELRGTVFGLYFGLSLEGRSLGQPVVGHFMDTLGIGKVFHLIALISGALSAVALLLLRRPKLRRSTPPDGPDIG